MSGCSVAADSFEALAVCHVYDKKMKGGDMPLAACHTVQAASKICVRTMATAITMPCAQHS